MTRLQSLLRLSFLFAVGMSPLSCGDDGLVGGSCLSGYSFCDGRCVPGGCGEGGASSGGASGGETASGGKPAGGAPSGGAPSGGANSGGTSSGGAASGGAANSGGNDGSGGDGLGGLGGDGSGGSGPVCDVDPFTTACGGICVDTDTDAQNCGACDQTCPSGICVAGFCLGSTPGHMIAMCMNYEQYSASAAQTVLLGNAVFLTNQEPARVLAFTGYSTPGLEATTGSAIAAAASARGRSYVLTVETDPDEVESALTRTNYDVLVVYDQPLAPAGLLATIGANWATTTLQFAEDGGVVVVLSGQGGSAEMGELVSALGILDVDGLIDHVGDRLYVQSPGDALGINVVSPFLGIQASCSFDTTQAPSGDRVFVVTDTRPSVGLGAPSVVHQIVLP